MPTKPLEAKRVGIAPMVTPHTKSELKRLSAQMGISQGEVVDGAIFALAQDPEAPKPRPKKQSRRDQETKEQIIADWRANRKPLPKPGGSK